MKKRILVTQCWLGAITVAVAASVVRADGKEGDINLGVDGAGQIVAEFDSGTPFDLPTVTAIPGDGFGLDDPGFFALTEDEPGEGIFALGPAAQIAVEFVSADPGLEIWNDPPISELISSFGDQWALPAGNSFDEHPFWFIDDPDFSELGETFDFQFLLTDLGGTYTDSVTYTATFRAVPEPATAMLLIVGAGIVLRRGSIMRG